MSKYTIAASEHVSVETTVHTVFDISIGTTRTLKARKRISSTLMYLYVKKVLWKNALFACREFVEGRITQLMKAEKSMMVTSSLLAYKHVPQERLNLEILMTITAEFLN